MDNRRQPARKRMLKSGRIVFNRHRSVIDCTVRNLTEGGACLVVASQLGIPDRFDLLIGADDVARSAQVVWRKNNRLGINFAN